MRWRLRAAAQQSFRRPTLNELYRPFRAGNVVTEANPNLRTERATSAEIGADYTHGILGFTTAAFWNELHDAVGNVTLARGPGTFPLFGFLAAGTAMQYLARRSEPRHERGAWQLRDLTDDSQAEPVQSGPHLRVAAQHGCGERRQKGRLVA